MSELIREYTVDKIGDGLARCYIADDYTLPRYSAVPTLAEVSAVLGENIQRISLDDCFSSCRVMVAAPNINRPDVVNVRSLFMDCTALSVAPAIPARASNDSLERMLQLCPNLLIPPVIPDGSNNDIEHFFDECHKLQTPVSIPASKTRMLSVYEECQNMTGEMIVRPTSLTSYVYAFRNTVEPITLYGDQTVCETLADTGNHGNVTWSPWYDPIPAVTNRGQGSYTTAEDMTRMVRNGALAVDSYAPGRMVYAQGDIVRADEWAALVEAAQTIDPTVTLSTHYTNLNKIEKAFDDAL